MEERKNKTQLKDRYILKTDSWSSHSIIYQWLSKYPPGTKVIDIGTANGIIGKKCKDFGFYLKGIEPDKVYAAEAESYYDEFICSSLENAPEEFLAKQDVVICADILEHTSDPQKLLTHLVELQHPRTEFLISIPNIAHIWVRLNLAIGRFNYTDCGILDRTHLRFFTKQTFFELLYRSNLRPVEIKYTAAPLSRITLFFQNNIIGRMIQKVFVRLAYVWPGLFAYQFLVRSEIFKCEERFEA